MEWFVSIWDEGSGFRRYRGGHGSDRAWVIEQVIAAGRALACPGDDSAIGVVGDAVIDGTVVDSIAFGDCAISDENLVRGITARLDRVRGSAPPS